MVATPVSPELSVEVVAGEATTPILYTEQMLRSFDSDVTITDIVKGHWLHSFQPVGNVPGTNSPAFGFFLAKQKELQIRHGMNVSTGPWPRARDLSKKETQYTEVHEWGGHGSDYTTLTNVKREKILHEMGLDAAIAAQELVNGGDHDKAIIYVWNRGDFVGPASRVKYWNRPYEAYADMLVSAITSLPSIFESRYIWDIGADKLKEIVLSTDPVLPVPGPTPEPLPEPIPPQIIMLEHGQSVLVSIKEA
jgi:hypothetical protein